MVIIDVFPNALQPPPKEVLVKQGDQVWVLDHDAVRTYKLPWQALLTIYVRTAVRIHGYGS